MKRIVSRDNPTFRHLRALVEDGRVRREHGRCVIEGAHLLRAALDAGVVPRCVVWSDEAQGEELDALGARCQQLGVDAIELSDALLRSLADVRTPSGVLAEVDIPPAHQVVEGDMLVVERVQDAGNLGTLLRTAAAAGIRRAVLSEGCAQAWSPKVLRAGMGAHFLMAVEEDASLAECLRHFDGEVIATVLADDAVALYDCDLRGPTAWLFGAEGQGLSPDIAARATRRVFIPMPGGTDSLNVAAAAAICLFEQTRQRRQGYPA